MVYLIVGLIQILVSSIVLYKMTVFSLIGLSYVLITAMLSLILITYGKEFIR